MPLSIHGRKNDPLRLELSGKVSKLTRQNVNLLGQHFSPQQAQVANFPPYVRFPKELVSNPHSAQAEFPVQLTGENGHFVIDIVAHPDVKDVKHLFESVKHLNLTSSITLPRLNTVSASRYLRQVISVISLRGDLMTTSWQIFTAHVRRNQNSQPFHPSLYEGLYAP